MTAPTPGERSSRQNEPAMWQPRLLMRLLLFSLAAHAAFLCWQLLGPNARRAAAMPKRPLKLVYEESRSVHEQGASVDTRSRLRQLPAPSSSSRALRVSVSEGVGSGASSMSALMRGLADADSPNAFGGGAGASGKGSSVSDAIDLTDVVRAAQGDPISLSYFSAIREQIQGAADDLSWLPEMGAAKGIVYVVFKVDGAGGILSIRAAADQPEIESKLGDIAARIVQEAAPFPAFPPSFQKDSLAIMVPLDFASGT